MSELRDATPHVAHVFFGQARKLSPLMAELRTLSDAVRQTLIVPGYDQDPEYLAKQIPDVYLRCLRMRSREWSDRQTPVLKLLRFKEFMLRAHSELRRVQADIIVAHDMPAVLPLLGRLLRGRTPVVFHAHELWTEAAEQLAPFRPLWSMLERFAVRRANRIIVPEPNRARIVHEEYGAPRPPAVVMNVPHAPPVFERGTLLREHLGVDDNAVCILYQGLLGETRCVLELAQAVLQLPSRFHLVLIGLGEEAYMNDLREVVRASGGRLHLLDWMHPEDLRAFTASADVGVLLYRNRGRNNYYAAPNKLYEYLFAGLPVVTSAFPGLQSAVEGGAYGYCCDPARPEDIARAIEQASDLIPGEVIARRARETWRWSDQADVLRSVYHELYDTYHAE